MRLSRHCIISTRREDGTWALLHGVTGAVDLVTDRVVAGLRGYGTLLTSQGDELVDPQLPPALPPGSLTTAEVATLADRGYLTALDDAQEIAFVQQAAEVLHEAAAQRPSFLAVPTLDCNYRCTYCFERPVQINLTRLGTDRHKELDLLDIRVSNRAANVVMTPEVVEAMFLAMATARKQHGDTRERVPLVLYGGEPLDARNEQVVREIVSHARLQGCPLAVITNGHHIDRFIDLFGPDGIQQVQISIDGPQRVHDARRISMVPGGSFETLVRHIDMLLERGGVLVQVRVHLDDSNVAHFDELVDFFEGRGWLGHPDLLVYVNTVYKLKPGEQVDTDISLADIDARLRGHARRHRNLLLNAPAINQRAKWMPALLRGDHVPAQATYCTANTGQYVFAPDGHMYACWESVGRADSRVGTFFADGQAVFEVEERAATTWFTRHVGLIPECARCPMALSCGGGCAQFARYNSGSHLKPYCDNFGELIRTNLAETADTLLARFEASLAGEPVQGLVAANYG